MTPWEILLTTLVLAAELALAVGLAPLLTSVVRRRKSRSQRRTGPSMIQPYLDLAKLWGKGTVYVESSSAVTRAAPLISFASLLAAVPFVPWFFLPAPLGFAGDLIVVVGLLALSRFMTAVAALDAGSTFGGMGSTRDMWIGALFEPTFLLVIFAWGAPSGSTQASTIVLHGATLGAAHLSPALLLASAAFALLLLAETGRLPVDNPATHLELTMVHEAMVLEYGGRDLALIELGQSLRMVLLLELFVAVLLPWGIALSFGLAALALALVLLLVKLLAASALLGELETRVAKWRLFRVADLAVLSWVLALGSISLTYLVGVG
ncbi:MAG: NADH-quinone oxidoreductase subunit H [Euryarchaeota archaeon]|nr:NADH-quinone oxidoreductase subunit H [Euryarchaeota archaeon]MDE1837605.1 NADH-quinone oxidoreductase subunit H [Euryarchaeota archaeon]MDE2045916.1 NADH-quinone oxidoreductase subunit H [Thermoplasmata archaeon]